MSRYIDVDQMLADESAAYMEAQIALAEQNADKTIDATRYINQLVHKKIQMLIADTPSIDIVRCKECVYRGIGIDGTFCERRHEAFRVKPDDFCSYGERGEDGKATNSL